MARPLPLRVFLCVMGMASFFACASDATTDSPAAGTPNEEVVKGEATSKTVDRNATENAAGTANVKTGPVEAAPQRSAPTPTDEATVVASIADWNITGKDLRQRVYREAYPDPYDMTPRLDPVDLSDVVFLLLGENALAMEAHKQGMHKQGAVATTLERYRATLLVNKLMSQIIKEEDVQVNAAEVKAFQQIRPKLDEEQAKAMLMRAKAQKLGNDFVVKLLTSRHVKKNRENFPKVAALHQRLLLHPKEPRINNVTWILRKQIQSELMGEEKKLVLATFDGGSFTAEDWFTALHQMAPPGRPKDLGTEAGVESFLDRSLRQPLLCAEAIDRGLDKDPEFIQKVREREYNSLYNQVRSDLTKDVPEPTDEEVAAHYATLKERFGRDDSLQAQLFWCENKAAALQAKAELDEGKAFDAVQAKYAVDKKDLEPKKLSLRQEGMFWQGIWACETNKILGPVLGFGDGGFRWRIIKVLEKESKEPKELDDNFKRTLKWELRKDRVDAQLRDRMKKLLQTYPHKVFKERLAAYEPANTP